MDTLHAADQTITRPETRERIEAIDTAIRPEGKTDAEILVAASHALHSTLYLSELYHVVLRILLRVTQAQAAVLLIQRPRTHHPVVFKIASTADPVARDLPIEVGRTYLDQLKEKREHTDDSFATPEQVSEALSEALGDAISQVHWVRLAPKGRFLGVIGIVPLAGGFGDRTASLLEPLAVQASVALDNAMLFRRAERESLQNQLLLDASHLLLSSLNLDEILDAIMNTLQRVVPYNAAGIFLVNDQGETERIVDRGYDRSARPILDQKANVGLVGWVASTGKSLIIDDARADSRYVVARAETQSEMVVPILAGDHLVGVFNLERDVRDGFFEVDLDLVQALAQHAGVAIERAKMHESEMERRRIKGELEVARSIQMRFQPDQNPVIEGYDIAGVNIPSEEVGGDYYDFIRIVEGQLGIAIADSSGKGIPAALIMAAFRASLIAEIRNNYSLHVIMQKVNDLLCEGNEVSRFVTTIYGVLDAKSRVFTYSNAGHNPGILLHPNGNVVLLNALGTALGLFPKTEYEERVIGLTAGDLLFLYTDGVTDVVGKNGDEFEIDRLIGVLKEHAGLSVQDVLRNVRNDVMEYADPNEQVDDFTMVAIKVL
ncbi:MAG: SpoIIE family protein phosphatase [candidate division Zixibacteria bacterium]|nr:SpoIIE family protein phosphatase [candidate division Zixibacteria bacterium]